MVESRRVASRGKRRDVYIHPTAEVHASAQLGPGTMVWNWTKIREQARIGADCRIGQCAYLDAGTSIGDRCKIQNGVSVYAGVTLCEDVLVGPNVTFTNDLLPRAHSTQWEIVPTRVEPGASVGANATIVCGITLGSHCMVAAGAVVTRDVPPHALVMGCPARVVDYVTIGGRRLFADPAKGAPPSVLLSERGNVGARK